MVGMQEPCYKGCGLFSRSLDEDVTTFQQVTRVNEGNIRTK